MKTVVFITDSDFSNTDKNFEYLLWFQPSFWWILLINNEINIYLDSRYFSNTDNIDKKIIKNRLWIEDLKINYILIQWWISTFMDSIIAKIKYQEKIYFENNISAKIYDYFLKNIWNTKIKLVENYFLNKRIIKEIEEINKIKKAIKIIDETFIYIKNIADKWELSWKTELEVRGLIIWKIMEYWWTWESFSAIVAFWKNSSIPHHNVWNTIIWNWVLLIDMWAIYDSYCSDFTRTFWVWEKTNDYDEFVKIKWFVKKAHNKSYELWQSWMTWKDIDNIARKSIKEDWYQEYFTHSLWHWIGLDVHENPYISSKSDEKIQNNMVFTIEPWIYIPSKFWVRLEDIIFVNNWKLEKHSKVEL